MGKVAILAVLLLAGCTTTKGGNFCQISSPMRLSSQAVDALSDAEVKQLLAHNKRGVKLCGWHP